jgi:WS/DGAT/MGAT family acyltransferase
VLTLNFRRRRTACKNQPVANRDRLTGLDASFLHLERDVSHMHVAACVVLEGPPPRYDELVEALSQRMHLVPRYRQRLAFVPFEQGRPVWVDDPHFHPSFHIRHTALPRPGGDEQLKRLAGRVFSQALDRSRPLWELWLVEGLADDRFAILSKTHHALVDGISGVDLISVLFDTCPDPMPVAPPDREWAPRPLPAPTQLLADALLERATVPAEIVRGFRHALRGRRQLAGRLGEALAGLGAMTWAGLNAAPPSPFNVKIGPHRRFTWVDAELAEFKAIKNALGGTVNDVVLAVVTGGLRRLLEHRGEAIPQRDLRAMVPVNLRPSAERLAMGNRLSSLFVELPVAESRPLARYAAVCEQQTRAKTGFQPLGTDTLLALTGLLPPVVHSRVAQTLYSSRLFNVTITNVPGPQQPLFALGARLREVLPLVPLAADHALGVAAFSYDGSVAFGLNGDYDAMPDLPVFATAIEASLDELTTAVTPRPKRATARPKRANGGPKRATRNGRVRDTASAPTLTLIHQP